MAERLTEAGLGLFDVQIRVRATRDRAFTDAAAKLLTEVRERREQDGAARLVCDGYTAAHRERDVLRTRVAELAACLREMLGTHGGVHGEGCHSEGWLDGDASDCTCGSLEIRDRARAALAKGGPNG